MGSMLPYIAAPWILWDRNKKEKIIERTLKSSNATDLEGFFVSHQLRQTTVFFFLTRRAGRSSRVFLGHDQISCVLRGFCFVGV